MSRCKDLKPRKLRSDRHHPDDLVSCKGCGLLIQRWCLSKAGLCTECGFKRVEDACRQLRDKRGEVYEKWLARTAATRAVKEVAQITGERR
ncbi:hypothetical protein ES703_121017 [subsurface metagenome]